MNKKLIIANWKCNPTTEKEAITLFQGIGRIKKIKNAEIVICPPFIYLKSFPFLPRLRRTGKFSAKGRFASGGQALSFKLGAQNCFYEEKGAFTGEISAKMLKDAGVKYVIIGHSERRRFFSETEESINKKIKAVLNAGMSPILCVGETGEQKEKSQTFKILESQIIGALSAIPAQKAKNIVIAYEPVWAIGTGRACSVDDTLTVILFIRNVISKKFGRSISKNISILYGGSANSKNAGDFFKEKKINGLLVGGASLDAKEFSLIAKIAG